MGADSPVVFGVEVGLAIAVLQKERSKALLIVRCAAVDELVETVAVIYAVTCRNGAAVKTTRKVVCQVVKVLPANICSQFEVVLTKESREVVNELVIGLITLNRKVTRTADARLRRNRARIKETNDRSIVAGRDVDE